MKCTFGSSALIVICLAMSTGCSSSPAPGDPDVPVKTEFTQAEIDQMKAEGMSDAEIENMNYTVKE